MRWTSRTSTDLAFGSALSGRFATSRAGSRQPSVSPTRHASAAGLDVLPSGDPGHLGFVHPLRGLGQGAGSRREANARPKWSRIRRRRDSPSPGRARGQPGLGRAFDDASEVSCLGAKNAVDTATSHRRPPADRRAVAQSLFYTDRIDQAARVLSEVSVQADASSRCGAMRRHRRCR